MPRNLKPTTISTVPQRQVDGAHPMRFVLISDTHGLHDHITLPKGDILLHCGDFTNMGMQEELDDFFKYVAKYGDGQFKHIVMIVGNHEWAPDLIVRRRFNKHFSSEQALLTSQYHLLLDEELIIHDDNGKPIKIYGSRYKPSISLPLMRDSVKKNVFESIPHDIDMLLTHFPVIKNKMDVTCKGKSRGSEELTKLIDGNHFNKLKVHCFGHNHDTRGFYHEEHTDRLFVNGVSIMGDKHQDNVAQPFVFDF